MSSSMVDLRELHEAYTRLSEKFKTCWTFHQFLLGLHKTFFRGAPQYTIEFQPLYEEIRAITEAMQSQSPAQVMTSIQRRESKLETLYQTLSEEDSKIAPNLVRRFFEKVKTEDEKLLMALVRFYFYSPKSNPDVLDKMDFLLTLVGSRKSLTDGHSVPRFPHELQKLFSSFLSEIRRPPVNPEAVKRAVLALEIVRKDIEECARFEDLTGNNVLESLRTLKRSLGPAFFTVEVLTAVLLTNVVAKNRFQMLFDEEERLIAASAAHLESIERGLEGAPGFDGQPLQAEFRRVRRFREDFEKGKNAGSVRHQNVTQLAGSIGRLLAKVDSPGASPEPEARAESEPEAPVQRFEVAPDAPTGDPLTADAVGKLLELVTLAGSSSAEGRDAYARAHAKLRPEPWELAAAERVGRGRPDGDSRESAREMLFFESTVLRTKIESEAQRLRGVSAAGSRARPDLLKESGTCLIRSQEMDRRFRAALDESGDDDPRRVNELNRSRFRLLRSFSGLWLLHDAAANPT